jgi:protein involved in polysaccharide export with SLBB domain
MPNQIQATPLEIPPVEQPYIPGEFERFVQRLVGTPVRRLGAEMVTGSTDWRSAELTAVVPPDYVVSPGDEILLLLWGSVDADLRLVVDRAGRINVPRVGAIQVGGIRHMDLVPLIERRVGQVFKNFQLSVTLGQLRGVRVVVTGFVAKPGVYTVSALSTVVGALMRAGGPAAAGSFRQIDLRRNSALIARVDLYDLLLSGNRATDRVLQTGDVVHVGQVGPQVGVVGSVNRPVVVELLPGEVIDDALRMAGGFSAVADRNRLVIERLSDRSEQRVTELQLPRDAKSSLSQGDVLRILSSTELILSTARQTKRIRVEGEVQRPGEYLLPPDSTLQDALKIAGGLSRGAFLYGSQFTRESVRATQQENYERALRDLETDFARSSSNQRLASSDDVARAQVQATGTARLIDRLRALKPGGRVVLQLTPSDTELPSLVLEDGDRLYVPPKPTTVGVFGSVFNTGSYLFDDGRTLDDYLRLAGGPTKGADHASIFVARSNGQVISGRQRGGDSWWGNSSRIGEVKAEPGDTVFVPEEMDKTTAIQAAKDWTQILYQFGIGLAGIKSALN